MKDIETRFPKREQKIRRNYEIEDGLYNRLEDLTLSLIHISEPTRP